MSLPSEQDSYKPPADLKSRLADSYDKLAPTYNAWKPAAQDPRLIWLPKLLDKLSTPDDNEHSPIASKYILELGAGAGLPTTKALLDHDSNAHVSANELSPVQIGLLKDNLSAYTGRLTAMPGDMLAIDIEPSSLSAVVGMYSIIHLPRDEQIQLLKKISAWLRPGGYLLANFAAEEAKEVIMENWLKVEGAWTYWSAWGKERTLAEVAGAGLEIIESDVVGGAGVDADFLWVLARKP